MTEKEMIAPLPPSIVRMTKKLPLVFDWVEFKGETVFAGFNYDASIRARKPMMDIFYCATRALNHVVLFTTQWDKNKFKSSLLGHEWNEKIPTEAGT